MNRIAVVGFGFMGQTHTLNILNNSDLELVAIVDKNHADIHRKLNEQKGNFTVGALETDWLDSIRLYSDFSDCLQKEDLDAVVLSVHTNLHYHLAQEALEAGLHVFLEKPFVLDPTQGEALIDLARAKGVRLMIGHVLRFMPPYLKLKHYIDSGELGELQFLSLSRFSGLPAWGEWKIKQQDFGSSGGALFDLLIHDIDYAQWVCGVPDTISSIAIPGKLSNHDYVSALWGYKSRTLQVKIDGGNIFHSAFPFGAGFSALFEKASLFYSSADPEFIKVASDEQITTVPAGDANLGFSNEMAYFASILLSGDAPELCSPESALETIRICRKHF